MSHTEILDGFAELNVALAETRAAVREAELASGAETSNLEYEFRLLVEHGRIARLRKLLKENPNAAREFHGLAVIAADYSQVGVLELLIEYGADLDERFRVASARQRWNTLASTAICPPSRCCWTMAQKLPNGKQNSLQQKSIPVTRRGRAALNILWICSRSRAAAAHAYAFVPPSWRLPACMRGTRGRLSGCTYLVEQGTMPLRRALRLPRLLPPPSQNLW